MKASAGPPNRLIVNLNKQNKLEHVHLKQLTYSKHLFLINTNNSQKLHLIYKVL